MEYLTLENIKECLSWQEAINILRNGHLLPKATMHDVLMGPANGMLLNRTARIEGLGYGVKVQSIFNENQNKGISNTHGVVLVYSDEDGRLRGLIDSNIVTDLKTAADSVLGATILANPNSEHLVVVGAGRVARNIVLAYCTIFPKLKKISVWSRRIQQSKKLVKELENIPIDINAIEDLPVALSEADIVSVATMSSQPIIRGEWIYPGTHIDLIGAYKEDMREADDALIIKSELYVDNYETTQHIGEIALPIKTGVIQPNHIKGDLYNLVSEEKNTYYSPSKITIFKNGGGAHLDLMIADSLLSKNGL